MIFKKGDIVEYIDGLRDKIGKLYEVRDFEYNKILPSKSKVYIKELNGFFYAKRFKLKKRTHFKLNYPIF